MVPGNKVKKEFQERQDEGWELRAGFGVGTSAETLTRVLSGVVRMKFRME